MVDSQSVSYHSLALREEKHLPCGASLAKSHCIEEPGLSKIISWIRLLLRLAACTKYCGRSKMTLLKTQTAVIQSKSPPTKSGLPLVVSHSRPVPEIPSPYHVFVRVLAVALNPTDHKMITHFYMEGNTVGCDFCGIVEATGSSALFRPGDRVCGAEFPYRPDKPLNGAFTQYMVVDSRHMLRIPDGWSATNAAALGAIGWGTACLAISDPEALNLPGVPSRPVGKSIPVLIYGGATATGIMAIQLLKLSVLRSFT